MRYLAALFMFMDHLGMVLYPNNSIFRMIGRLAMPIFAYGVAMGFIHTSSLKKYIMRLGVFTLVSQPFFMFMGYSANVSSVGINIGATFLIACICLGLVTNRITTNNKIIDTLMLFILLVMSEVLQCDYGIYGVIVVIAFYKGLISNDERIGYMWFAFITLIYSLVSMANIQLFALLSIILLPYAKNKSKYMPKYFFYVFYPAHMMCIVLIKMLFY